MLITAAVVPGPPAFVPGLMGSAAHELDDLRDAADRAVSGVLQALIARSGGAGDGSDAGSAQLVVVGPGQWGEFGAAGPVSFAGFGRDLELAALVEGKPVGGRLPTPIMVARYLASRDIEAHPGHATLWAGARWITTSGDDSARVGEQLAAHASDAGLILVADGAACHGPKAPRAQDDRAQAYDEGVWAALASGQPGRLAQIDAVLGQELGANGYQVWPVLAAAFAVGAGSANRESTAGAAARTAGVGSDSGEAPAGVAASAAGAGSATDEPSGACSAGASISSGATAAIGEVLWAGAPYGVGWAVATWRRP